MSKLFVVEVQYDYETRSVAGIFTDLESAEEVAKELRKDDMILDGVYVSEEKVFSSKKDWDEENE